jgi:hypothetical protein
VRFEVVVRDFAAVVCNCSVCAKKGFVHLIVPPEDFRLLRGADALRSYRFNTEQAEHLFCETCGIHAYYVPRSHPDHVDINVRCLDGEVLDWFRLEDFDGRNWEASIHTLR